MGAVGRRRRPLSAPRGCVRADPRRQQLPRGDDPRACGRRPRRAGTVRRGRGVLRKGPCDPGAVAWIGSRARPRGARRARPCPAATRAHPRGEGLNRQRTRAPLTPFVSSPPFPSFLRSRSNIRRSYFERTPAASSIAAACSRKVLVDVDKGLAELETQAQTMIDDLLWWAMALKTARNAQQP